jgi:hypothetical protein
MPAVAKHRQVTEQLGSASSCPIQLFGCSERLSSGNWLPEVSALQKKYNTPTVAVRLCHSAVWNVAEMTLEINLYQLTVPFERCVLEIEQMEKMGKFCKILKQKLY